MYYLHTNFCSSLDGIWTHTIDTLQPHSLSLKSSALDHSTTSTIYIYIHYLVNARQVATLKIPDTTMLGRHLNVQIKRLRKWWRNSYTNKSASTIYIYIHYLVNALSFSFDKILFSFINFLFSLVNRSLSLCSFSCSWRQSLQCINGVGSNPVERRTKIWQL
jgi:hypothetical protein